MDNSAFTARVLNRTTGPPCSNIVTFCVESHPGVTYCAYAVSDGAIIVQQSLKPAQHHHGASKAAATGAAAAAAAAAPASFSGPAALAGGSGHFAPVLLIAGMTCDHGADCFGRICWGGGPEALLAAATKQHVYLFSLLPFFKGPATQLPRHVTPSLPLPSTACVLSGLYRTTMPALAIDFTQDVRGLLLTDSGNYVTMLQLVPKESLSQPFGYGSGGAGSSRSSAASTAAAEQHAGAAKLPLAQRQHPVLFAVHEAWRVRADAAHTLAAASLGCYSPCATTTAAAGASGGNSGSGGPQKVTIWWPAKPEAHGDLEGAGRRASGGGGGGAAAIMHSHGAQDVSAVGAEIVRHPVRVLSLEWSPPLAGSRAGGGGGGGVAAASSTTDAGGVPAAAAAAASAGGAAAAAATAAAAVSAQLAAPPPAPSTAPALMTLGADWVIRIYVEVVMRNMLPPELAASAAGLSMSQFCLTLVIEPPSLNLLPSSRPGMRACWAKPLGSSSGGGEGTAAVTTALYDSASGGSGAAAGGGAAAGVGPPEGQDAGREDGGDGSGDGGSRLQWIVASVCLAAHEDADAAELGAAAGVPMDEAVCVWAVDGLSSVVLSGMPRGSVSSAKTAASPKAVLWGIQQRSVSWLQPGKLLPASPTALRPGDFAIAAYVSYPGGMPLLAAGDSCVGMQGAYAEVRSYQISPTAAATPAGSSQTATYLRIASLARQIITGNPETISSMLVHPAADVALLRDRTGGVALWALRPLCELPIAVAPAAASASRVLLASVGQLAAVVWLSYASDLPSGSLPTPAAPAPVAYGSGSGGGSGMVGYVACIHGGRLLVYAVLLPPPAAAAGGSVASTEVNAATAAWGATFLSEVLRVELPPGIVAVQSLHEVSYDVNDAATGTVMLVALATHARDAIAGGSSGSAGCAVATAEQHQVWVTWRLRIQREDAAAGLCRFALVSSDVNEVATLFDGAVTRGSVALNRRLSSCTALVSCCCSSLGSPMDADIVQSTSHSSSSTNAANGVSMKNISSCSSNGGRRAVPCFMSGSSDGHVQFWRPALTGAPAADDGTAEAAGLELVQSLPCSADTPGGSGESSNTAGGGAGVSADANPSDVATAGMVVAVALDEMSGYAAAATTCGDGEDEEAVYIWRLRDYDNAADDGDDGMGEAKDGSTGQALVVRAGRDAYGKYELETVVPVSDTVSALSWLAAAGMSASLAVGYACGRVGLLVRDRRGGWEEVATYAGAAAVSAFGSARGGVVAFAAGNHLLCLSNSLDGHDEDNNRSEPTLAALAADQAGPLAPYHPGSLHALVAKGRIATACRVLRRLLSWLREGSRQLVADADSVSGSGEGSKVVSGGAREGDGDGGSGKSRSSSADGGSSGGGSVAACRSRQALVVEVSELLSGGLLTSRGLAAFQQALTTPTLPAPPTAAPAPSSAAAILAPFQRATGNHHNGGVAGATHSHTPEAVSYGSSRAGRYGGDDASAPMRPLALGGMSSLSSSAVHDRLGGGGGSGGALQTGSAIVTGALDMSAFGDFSTSGGGTAGAQATRQPPTTVVSTVESGTLDMLAFGGFGSFGRVDDATPVAAAAPAVKPPPPQRQPPSALETGTLDMSAFGVFGGFGAEPAPPPPPPPLAAQMVRSQQGALDTGMLNMSAFAGFGAEPPPPPRPSPPKSALESGTLDFSAFSGFGGFAVDPPPPSPPLQPPPQPSPSRHASALDSGMLDMSAFGGFGGFGQEPPPPPPPPAPLPPAPPPPPPPPQPRAADPLHSGMLDMSAFGGFGIGQYSQQDDGDAYDNRAAAAASRAPVPVIISEATPPAPSTLTSAAAAAPPPLDTGMLDMSSFGGFDMGWTAPPPPPPLPPATAAESPPRQLGPPLPAAYAFEPRPSLPPRSALDSWTSSSSGPADSVPVPAASSSQPSVATTATRSAGASGNVNDPWVTFPRVPEPATAADPELPELLLAADEVAELHRLLGQDPPSSQNDPLPKPALTAVLDSAAAAAPRKRRGSDGADDAVEDAVASLRALGLTPEDGLELCRLAVALSRKTVEQLGGGGGVGGGGATDVTAGLDFAARAFLVQARLAAVGAHAAAAAAAATGGQDDGAFAAAVSRLFRPVSVSRSSAAPPASNPVSSAPSSATLASPGTIGAPSAFSATATRQDPAANPSDPTSYSLGKPTSRKGLRTSGAGTRGSRGASGGTSGPASRRSRSVRSVLSVFSFASLPGSLYGDGSGSTNVAGDVGAVHHNDGDGGSSSSSWWRLCGLMEGLDMRSCLTAVASGSQAQLLEAVLPSVPWVASVDEEASAVPDGRHAGGMMGFGAGSGSSSAAASQPRPALSWPLLRKVGAGFWLADPRVVREQAEALAKAQYARRKEPYDCALLYLALGRKALLLSLFRQASNLKIAEFLLKDFSQPEPRRSAAKNAFALLGQHRYELAAAFFILAAQPQEAVSVLVRERRDPQLALLVARLLDAPAAGGNGGGGGIMSVSSSGSSSLGLGGPLARRLIEKELLPLALASRDPCAVACLDLLAGQPLRAVMRLLCCGGGGGAVPGAGGSSGRSGNDGSSGMGMAGSMGEDAAAAGGREGPGLALDATALDYCLQVGVQHLSGKPVPRSACRSLRRLALRTSRVLEQAGLASAALEALLVAAALTPPAGPPAATRAGPLPPAMARRYSRLLAACLSFSLGEVASPTEREPQPQQHDCMSQGEGGAGWQRRALQALAALGPMLSHSSVDQTAVLRLLGRHVNASKRVRQQPLVPPELLMTRPPPPASAAAAAHTSHPHQQQQPPPQQQQQPGHAQQLPRQQGSAGGTPLPALPAHQHPHALLRGTGPGQGPHGPDSGQQQGPTYPGMGPGHQSAFAAVGSAGGTVEQGAAAATAAHLARLRVSRSNSGGGAGGGGAGSGYSSGRLSPQSSTGSLFGGAAAGSGGTAAAAAGVPGGLGVSPEGSACSTPGGPMGHQQHRQSSGSFSGPQGRPPVPPPAYMAAGAGGYPHQQGPMGRHQPPAAPSSPKSSAHGGEGARRGEGVANGGGGGGPSGWGAFEAPWDVLAVEGDRCRAVAVLRGRGRGVGEEGQLPFAVATAKSGLLGGLLGPPALAPPPKSAAAGPSSLFLGLMQSVLHHVRWTPDPWAMMSGDFGVDMAVAPGGTAAGGGGTGTGGAASAGGGGGGSGPGGQRGGHPGPPTHAASSAGGGGSAGGPGVTGGTSTVTLAAHPETDVYLSGSSSLLVYQWRFGEPHAHTAYVPCLEPYAAGGPGAAAAAAAARSRAAATGGGGGPASAAASVASALDLHAPHWGHAAALSYSTPSGGRFAGIGEGGLVALWRADAMGPGGLGYADWTHQCVSRHGRAVSFVGDSSSQVLVAGQGERGGLVGWWDSLAPSSAACVAEIRGRKALPTALALLRPDAGGVLVFGDEAGDLVATDLRMMSAREYIWTIPRAHSGPVTAMAQWGHTAAGVLNLPPVLPAGAGTSSAASSHPYQPPVPHQPPVQLQQARMSNLLVSGGKDGSLALVDISSGRVVASLDRAHNSTRTGLPGLLAAAAASTGGAHRAVDRSIVRRSRPATAAGVAVSGLCCMPDAGGVLSCGADGAVRYHPFAPQLLDLRR